jgi:hypothetical protein
MRPGRFLALSSLANLGISAAYAAVGALSANVNSFAMAFAGALLLPAAALAGARMVRLTRAAPQ